MDKITGLMRTKAKELLENGKVERVLGWEKGMFFYSTPPVFIDKPEDAEKLVWDDFAINNLAIYLLDGGIRRAGCSFCQRLRFPGCVRLLRIIRSSRRIFT